MRRIRPPEEEMARKVETVSREARSVLPSTGYRSRSGVAMAGCGSQSGDKETENGFSVDHW